MIREIRLTYSAVWFGISRGFNLSAIVMQYIDNFFRARFLFEIHVIHISSP